MKAEKEQTYWQMKLSVWKKASEHSDLCDLQSIQKALQEKNYEKAENLLAEFIDDFQSYQQFCIENHLTDLMYWRMRWEAEPAVRTGETALEIYKITDDFGFIFHDPGFDKTYIDQIWENCFLSAAELAKIYTDLIPDKLSWDEIFEFDYKTF